MNFMNTGRTSEVLSLKTMDVCGYLHLHRKQKWRGKKSLCHLSTDQRDEYWWGNRTAGVQWQERGQDHERGSRCIFTCRGWKHLLNIILYYQFWTRSHTERRTTAKAYEILDLCEIGNINAVRLLRFFWKLKRWPSKITTWSTNPTCMSVSWKNSLQPQLNRQDCKY